MSFPQTIEPLNAHERDHLERLLSETEAASLLGYSKRALQNWRLRGGGPLFVKVSARSVRYRRRDLFHWIEARVRASTSATSSSDHHAA